MSHAAKKQEVTRITRAERTCIACPAQWDAYTDDGRKVYVRYQHGFLSVRVGEEGDMSEFAAVDGKPVFGKEVDQNGLDGFITYDELKAHTSGVIEWPESDQ